MKQVHVYVSGFVQGVGFRAYVRSKARKMGINGWVRNPTDGGQGQEITGGVKSLFEFVELFQGKEKRVEYESLYRSTGVRYGDIKASLSEAIFSELRPIQEKRVQLENNTEYVDQVIREGAEKARAVAQTTIDEVRSKMGLK